MADLAKDIEQLSQLQNDLEELESIRIKIKAQDGKIRERETELRTQHIPEKETREEKTRKEIIDNACFLSEDSANRIAVNFGFAVAAIEVLIASVFLFRAFWAAVGFSETPLPFGNAFTWPTFGAFIGLGLLSLLVPCLAVLFTFCVPIFIPFGIAWLILFIPRKISDKNVRLSLEKNADRIADARARDEQDQRDLERKLEKILETDSTLQAYKAELNQLIQARADHTVNMRDNDVLSHMDKSLPTVDFVLSQLKNKRADSIKEALQRYDEKVDRDERERERQREREEERREAELQRERDREEQRKRDAQLQAQNEALRNSLEEMKRKLDE